MAWTLPSTPWVSGCKAAIRCARRGPSGFVCGVGPRPSDWAIGFDDGSGIFYYKSPTGPIEIFDGVMSLTPLSSPTTKRQCMKDGWKAFEGPNGPFKNQGDCIQFVNTGK
jgi:hypothetical protein